MSRSSRSSRSSSEYSNSSSQRGYDDDGDDNGEESECDYRVGGYHRVAIGDQLGIEANHHQWTILQKLGWGHFSTVWLGVDGGGGGFGAVKIQKSAENYVEAAEDEIRILKQLDDAAAAEGDIGGRQFVVRLLDSFTHTGPNGAHPVMVFPVLGDNLLTLLDFFPNKLRGLPLALVQEITWQVCAGLAFLHDECDVLHCDLKLENVLISGLSLALAKRLCDLPGLGALHRHHEREEHAESNFAASAPTAVNDEGGGDWITIEDHKPERFYSENELVRTGDLFWEQNFDYSWLVAKQEHADGGGGLVELACPMAAWIPAELVARHCVLLPAAGAAVTRYEFTAGDDARITLELVGRSSPTTTPCVSEESIHRITRFYQLRELNPAHPLPDAAAPTPPKAKHGRRGRGGGGARMALWRITPSSSSLAALAALEERFGLVLLHSRFPLSTKGLRIIGVPRASLKLDNDVQPKPLAQRLLLPCAAVASPRRRYIGTPASPSSSSSKPFEISVKICDLGNACWKTKQFADVIQTRQYRAPEVILGKPKYDEAADGWSLACLAFELYTGEFLFDPESSDGCTRDEDHLALITELLGHGPPRFMRTKHFYPPTSKGGGGGGGGELTRRVGELAYKPLKQVFRDGFPDLGEKPTRKITSFLLELLKWDPRQRAPLSRLLREHPFLRLA